MTTHGVRSAWGRGRGGRGTRREGREHNSQCKRVAYLPMHTALPIPQTQPQTPQSFPTPLLHYSSSPPPTYLPDDSDQQLIMEDLNEPMDEACKIIQTYMPIKQEQTMMIAIAAMSCVCLIIMFFNPTGSTLVFWSA